MYNLKDTDDTQGEQWGGVAQSDPEPPKQRQLMKKMLVPT